MNNTLKVGQVLYLDGCFTFESSIIGQSLSAITYKLGLPQSRMTEGAFIAYALRIPEMEDFEFAGITQDSTDKFVRYKNGLMQFDQNAFAKLFTANTKLPVNFNELKRMCHNSFAGSRLVKVLPAIRHQNHRYPPGDSSLQFLMLRGIETIVVAYIPPGGHFHGDNPLKSIQSLISIGG